MGLIQKPKFLIGVIIALLSLNLGTLTFMWTHQGPPGPRPNTVFNFLVNELKLTEEQTNKYAQLRDDHHSKMVEIQDKSRKFRDQLFGLLHAATADSTLVESLTDSIAANQKQVEIVTFDHFQKVRGICTPEQQKKFDAIINEAMHMMSPRPPRR